MTDVRRSDILEVLLAAGRRIGVAQMRAALSGPGHPDFVNALAETMRLADDVADVDPVAGRLIRELTLRVLHGEEPPLEGTAIDVTPAALEAPAAELEGPADV